MTKLLLHMFIEFRKVRVFCLLFFRLESWTWNWKSYRSVCYSLRALC